MPETEQKIRFSKCRVVRCKDFSSITEKCYKAVMPDDSELLIPASQFFGYAKRKKVGFEYIYLTDWICGVKEIKADFLHETVWLEMSENEEIIIKHKPEYMPPETGVCPDESLVR